jgi:ABC-2 type transport system permease protein
MHKILAFVGRDARLALSYPFTFWMQFASVLITVAGFYYMARLVRPSASLGMGGRTIDYFTYVVVNLAFMLLLTTALQAFSQTLRRDQVAGTLEAIFVTPTGIWLIVLASGGWPLLFGMLQTLAYFVFAFLFGLRFANVDAATLAIFLVLGMLSMAALGILGGAVVIRYKQTPPSTFLVGSAAALLTGVLFPISLLPRPLQVLSWLLPMTHALNGFRAAMIGAPPVTVAGDAIWLGAASLFLIPAALTLFARAYDVTRREASLGYY